MNACRAAMWLMLTGLLAAQAVFVQRGHAQSLPGAPHGSQTGDGGGTFSGLASSPDANLFTGVAQTSIPIQVPPGRLGMAPVLALAYSSSSGPGPYGYGWDLPLPRIHRSTRFGVPRYDDSDRFVLEMPGAVTELERIPGSPRGFRARVESAFLRIGFHDDDNAWKVVDKLGVTFTFGASAATRTGRGPSRSRTFAWLLERIEDPAGNRIEFTYRTGGDGGTSNGLPERIHYGANARTGAAAFAAVSFEWSPLPRSSAAPVSWRNGFAEKLDVRLSAIQTETHGLRARRYDFSHEQDRVTTDLRLIGATLTAYAEHSEDDITLPSTVFVYAPTMSSGWPATGSKSAYNPSFKIPGAGPLRIGTTAITTDNVDVNGDAIVDRVDTGVAPAKVMLGNGRGFLPPRTWNWPTAAAAPKAVRRSQGSGNLASNVFDLDGDSFADLVDSSPLGCGASAGSWCVWRGSADGFATTPMAWKSPVPLLRTAIDGGAKVVTDLIDLNADGRVDLVDSSSFNETNGARYWNVYPNTGNGFATAAVRFAAPVAWIARSDGLRLAYGLFDINSDSLPDLVSADPKYGGGSSNWTGQTAWKVHLNQGTGLALAPALWPLEPGDSSSLPNFLNLHAIDGSSIADLFDITGDGRPDLVRRWRLEDWLGADAENVCARVPSRCTFPEAGDSAISDISCCYTLVVYANTGSSFAQPVPWSSPAHGLRSYQENCPFQDIFACFQAYLIDFDFFDLDGDGLVDLVERQNASDPPGTWLVHPHPSGIVSGGTKPNLMVAMRNGVGGETMLRYTAASVTAETRLPFPLWVVRERELRDSGTDAPPLRTSFGYRGGSFDGIEHEMRGFALVQEVDPVGISRVREYHQDSRRAGRLRRLTALDPPPCQATRPDDPTDPCSPWRFPRGTTQYEWPAEGPVLLASETDVPMHGGTAIENLRVTTRYGYDAYGSIASRISETPMAATATTSTEYLYRIADRPGGMPDRYLVAKPSRVVTHEAGKPLPLVERTFSYEGQSATPGALVVASTCIEQTAGGCVRWSRRTFGYDPYGNVVVAHGPEGATSHTEYDASALFAIRSVDPVGLATESVTDPRTGRVSETVVPNGNRLFSRHDGLGRLLRTWGPGTSEDSPSLRIEYSPGSLGASPPRALTHDASRGSSSAFFDGFGRPIATKTATTSNGRAVTVVSGLQRRDPRGLVTAEVLPFDSDNLDLTRLTETFADAPARFEFGYDTAGRRTTTKAPDRSVRRVDTSAPGIVRRDDANTADGSFPGSVTLEMFDGFARRLLRDVCSTPPLPAAPYDCPTGSLVRREGWTYDALGRVEETRTFGLGAAAGDAVVTVARDGLGNRTSVTASNSGTWSYRHDDSGRVVEVEKPDGTRIATKYDVAGRLMTRRGPITRASYRYHSSGGGIGKLRRLVTRTRAARVSEETRYDDRGRVNWRRRRIGVRGATPADIAFAYEYDDFDRRIATRTIDRRGITQDLALVAYDDQGREVALSSGDFDFVRDVQRDSNGRTVRVDFGNGTSDLTSWRERSNAAASAGNLRCMRTTTTDLASGGACAVTPSDLEARVYRSFDPNGNLLSADDVLYPAGDLRRENLRYEYDALGRLLSAGTTASGKERFAFDPLGNLLQRGDIALDYPDPANPSRIGSIRRASAAPEPVQYDANGRRSSDGEQAYAYDDADRLVEVRNAVETLFVYGYLDNGEQVFSKDLRNGRVQFEFGDGVRVGGNTLEKTFFFDGRPVAVERRSLRPGAQSASAERMFLHGDHQQSVRLVTDQEGRAIEYSRYRAFGARRARLDGSGRPSDTPLTRFGYTAHIDEEDSSLLFFGARHYDPRTGAFLTLDPAMQYASPYAYSDGNPVAGRDADGTVFALTAIELLTLAVGTATFIDSIVRTGDLGHSLTAGVFAGFSVYFSGQLSTAVARPLSQVAQPWMQMAASVASDGFQAMRAVEAIEDGRYAGGVMAAGMLAASLIGIETASDPGPGDTAEENYARHGIIDRGVINGQRVIDVNGICSTRPGCLSNILTAARENLRVLFGGNAACVGGCEHVSGIAKDSLDRRNDVLLRCNSFGAIKCLGAVQTGQFAPNLARDRLSGIPKLSVEMSGAPLLRPPAIEGLTYQVNLFDPVVWVGTAWSTPLRSDVVLGRNWWVPTPVIVHHSRMYEKPFHEALGDMLR